MHEDLTGTVLGRWTLERKLGAGAMGPVYGAISPGRTPGALHVIRSDLVASQEQLDRFRRDAKNFQKVEHPNVPRLLDVDEANGRVFLVFELVTGRTLQYRLDQKELLGSAEARDLATDLLSALAALHDRGITHGDVKPASILSGAEGYWKLAGFSLFPHEEKVQLEGVIHGTPLFMAPERCEGLPPSIGADLYSAGATIFAALTGEAPYLRPSVAAILSAHVNDPPPDLAARVPNVEKDVLSLVSLLMAKSPARRPPDARTSLAVLSRRERTRSKTLPALKPADEVAKADAAKALPPEERPPGTDTTRRKAHKFVVDEALKAAPQGAEVPWSRFILPLLVALGLLGGALFGPPQLTDVQRLVLGAAAGTVGLVGILWGLAGTVPPGLSQHAVARTLALRVPLRLSFWWNRKRNPIEAAIALGQLGDLGAGEMLLESGEPKLAAEEFLRAGIPLAAAIVFEKLQDDEMAIETYVAAGKLDDAARVAQRSGKHELAGDAFESKGDLDKALQSFLKAERPLKVASVYERLGKTLEAARHYELASDAAKAASLYESAGSVADAARLYHRAGDLAKVSLVWEKAGDTVNAARWRAEHELAEGRRVNAARAFETAEIYDRASDLFLAQNLIEDAIRCAEAHGEPGRLARLCARAGNFKRAASLHEEAGQFREAAHCHRELGDAVSEAKALERAGDALAAAEVWLKTDRTEDAKRALAVIPAGSPDRKRARARLGELHARAGRTREAAEAFREALEGQEPDEANVGTFLECADALGACGEVDKAIEMLVKLRGLPFAPPTLKIRLAELERKRSTARAASAQQTSLGGKELVGLDLDRYKMLTYTGEGELSWAYEGEHTLLKRPADLRVLKPSVDEELTEQFFAEGRAIALASHPNLPDVYDSGRTTSGLSYVALEVARDPSLRQVMRQAMGPVPVARAVSIAKGILAGIAAAHSAGVVHGDLKPENILVGARDQARVVRFAFARQAAPGAGALPFLTAKAYASPEQIVGAAPGKSSDQYACGVILYEMLAGLHPFEHVTDQQARASTPPKPLSQVAPAVPLSLAQAIMKSLARDPEDRHRNVAEFLQVVTACMGSGN
jgi:serine/threonine protein kinase